MATKSNGNHPASAGAAIYVDTENLREPDLAQDVIAQTVADWPAEYPPVGSLSLYVRADKVALWRMWLEATYPELARRVRGVQHFSREMAKNSADLAITADAIGDLAAGQAGYIAVISNDSDFGALFVKVREMALDAGWERLPFLWITAPGGGAISPEIERFIPDRFRWNLPNASRPNPVPTWTQTPARPPAVTRKPSAQAPAGASTAPTPAPAIAPTPAATPSPNSSATPSATPSGATVPAPKARPTAATQGVSADDIADELIRQLPVGRFKAGDAQKIIKGKPKSCWSARRWALEPWILCRHHRRGPFRGNILIRWPQRPLVLVGDSKPCWTCSTAANRGPLVDAALYEPAPPRQPGRNGRAHRVMGRGVGSLVQRRYPHGGTHPHHLAAHLRDYRCGQIFRRSKRRTRTTEAARSSDSGTSA